MGREIERKFLVRGGEWRKDAGKGVRYRQGYLSTIPGRTVRVRVAGHKAHITIKGQFDGSGQDEFEYPIPAEDAEHMLIKICIHPLIEKTRYNVKHSGHKWEIDEFSGENVGLVIAEIELKSEDEKFEKPAWAGQEVTRDRRYSNASLSQHPWPLWGRAEE